MHGKDEAIRPSLIGAHLLARSRDGAGFVSPARAARRRRPAPPRGCHQHRCFPVLAGPTGADRRRAGLADHPLRPPRGRRAERGRAFDSTEIDEILTLRVMTMTDDEKAEARATDPRAAEIIDRCDAMSPEDLQQLHGILRDPHAPTPGPGDVPWWDPAADESVRPGDDTRRRSTG